jgi:signal transduction histidine kinase
VDQHDTRGRAGTVAVPRLSEAHADAHVDQRIVERGSVIALGGWRFGDAAARNGAGGHGADRITAPAQRPSLLARASRLSSRARMARRLLAAGDAERERIEQDIHDGVQAHLTALRVRLALAAERFQARGDTESGAVLAGFGDDVERAIDELRDLARGIYPALLTTYGLSAALSAAGVHTAEQVTVRANAIRRCRPDVEIAVYFTCLAALDNAAKHAGPARVTVSLSDSDGALSFTVCDSGAGFDPARTPHGSGITNMYDRITAVGGTLTIDSAPGRGTRVRGSVPAPWLDAAAT